MKQNLWKVIYGISALIGVITSIYGYETYLLTFINPIVPLAFCFIPALLIFFFIRNHYSKLYNTNKTYYPFLQSLLSIGFFTTSIFIIVNYQFSSIKKVSEKHEVIETGTSGGKHRKPYVIINRENQTKKLVFKNNLNIHPEDQITLTIQEGFFGFHVITEQIIIGKNSVGNN